MQTDEFLTLRLGKKIPDCESTLLSQSEITFSKALIGRWIRQPERLCSSAIPGSNQPIAGCSTVAAELAGQFDRPLGAS